MPDDLMLSAIDRVGQDVRDLRTDLTQRMDSMVTRREHDAETRRLDAEIAAARTATEANRKALEDHEAEAAAQWKSVAGQIEQTEKRRQDAVEAAAERRKADRRFIATWSTTAVGVGIALATAVTRWIGG